MLDNLILCHFGLQLLDYVSNAKSDYYLTWQYVVPISFSLSEIYLQMSHSLSQQQKCVNMVYLFSLYTSYGLYFIFRFVLHNYK